MTNKESFTLSLFFMYTIILVFIVIYFTGCAPKDLGIYQCEKPIDFVCTNSCDGLWVMKQNTWHRYYKTETNCMFNNEVIFEEYE